MNINMQNNSNFKGNLVYTQYTKRGLAKQVKYQTTPVQDKLVQIVANSMALKGSFSNRLSIENANVFKSLIEMIIKRPIKDSGEQKLLDNCAPDAVVFSSSEPGRNGMTVIFDFTE